MERIHNSSNLRAQSGVSMVELLMVVVITLIVAGIGIPSFVSMRRSLRISGDASTLYGQLLMAKMRASSGFTQSRLYFDRSARTFRVQIWSKPVPPATNGSWVTEGGVQPISQGVSYGYGTLSTPAGTQAAIGLPAACLNDTGATPGTGAAITNTSCIIFNSRGIPIDTGGSPYANYAIYLTDGNAVFANTVSGTGQVKLWRSPASAASWQVR
jgi:Tfp pilus assembly protein PilE